MPASKHKPITSSPQGSTPQSSTPIAPDQEEFRKSLRRLAVSAVQVLIEQVMRPRTGAVYRSLVGGMYA
jgi:putative transposase